MFVIVFRLLIFALIIYLIYVTFKYINNPKRKLELAHEKREFFFLDERENVRKNFLITYNGVLFEGEKYLGTTDHAFVVVSIMIWAKNPDKLQGLNYEDFSSIERKVKSQYPNAEIKWKSPIKEFIDKHRPIQ